MSNFAGRVEKRHQRNPRQALLGQCDPAVSESRTAANLDERKPAPPRRRENKRAKERQKKKKQAQPGLQRQRFGAWDSPRWKTEFSSAQRTGLERTEGSTHNPNIEQPKEGVKKEQVKGCGSENRPTPGSQRPAEPVASGFFPGVNFTIFRGRFGGLGVKLGVVDDRFSQCRAILHGVTIGVAAISCYQQGKQSARLSAVHFVRGRAPRSPSFFSAPTQPRPPQKLRRINKEKRF